MSRVAEKNPLRIITNLKRLGTERFKDAVVYHAGAEDVLTENQAIIVPAKDPVALRHAITRAYTDAEYRQLYERNGYRYAMNLQGEDQWLDRILTELRTI